MSKQVIVKLPNAKPCETPLEGVRSALEKWMQITEIIADGNIPDNYFGRSCSLCQTYNCIGCPIYNCIGCPNNCIGCPIYEFTDEEQCWGTPFEAFHDAITNNPSFMQKAGECAVAFVLLLQEIERKLKRRFEV
jgi:hypothetical protein